MKTFLVKDAYDDTSICIAIADTEQEAIQVAKTNCANSIDENSDLYGLHLCCYHEQGLANGLND